MKVQWIQFVRFNPLYLKQNWENGLEFELLPFELLPFLLIAVINEKKKRNKEGIFVSSVAYKEPL